MSTPAISLIVIFYRMARQAENTLYSLSTRHQRNVDRERYEIVAVENDSDDELGEERALAQGDNIRYFHRQEPGVSPVAAINFAFEQARGDLIGLIIDGARMASPRLVEHALLARKLAEHPLVVVPGYHLGDQEQHFHQSAGYDEAAERRLLEQCDWKRDGYALYDVSCFSGANAQGIFCPYLESNCLFFRRESFEKIGRADPRFDLPGGGSVNIFIYNQLARLPEARLIVLAGEGTFHQFHGGVTTAEVDDREAMLETHRENLREVFGGPFRGTHREPLVLGTLPGQVQPFIGESAEKAGKRHRTCKKLGWAEWNEIEPD